MNDTAKSLKDLLDRCVTNKEWYENVSLYSESLLLLSRLFPSSQGA